jgi:tetratricopeptide (TPR) repeat protein
VIDREALLGDAREDLLRSRYDQARQRYQELLQADDRDVEALTGMTRVALGKGELGQARSHADRVLTEQPDHEEAKILRLVVIEAEGDPRSALTEMQQLAERHPSSCLAAYHTGRLLAAFGRGDEALPWLDRAFAQADRARHRYAIANLIGYVQQDLGRFAEAVQTHQRAIEISAKRTEAYVALTDALVRGGDDEAGLTMLREAETRIGDHSDFYRKRAEILAAREDFAGARKAAQRVCDRHPDDATAWLTVAQLCLSCGDFQAAEQAATKSRNAAPEAWQPYFQLGLAYDAQNDGEQAETAYREALGREPDSWQPANNLGLALLARGTTPAATEAVELFTRAIELADAGNIGPRFNLALALARLPDDQARFQKLADELLGAELPKAQRDKLESLRAELDTDR